MNIHLSESYTAVDYPGIDEVAIYPHGSFVGMGTFAGKRVKGVSIPLLKSYETKGPLKGFYENVPVSVALAFVHRYKSDKILNKVRGQINSA